MIIMIYFHISKQYCRHSYKLVTWYHQLVCWNHFLSFILSNIFIFSLNTFAIINWSFTDPINNFSYSGISSYSLFIFFKIWHFRICSWSSSNFPHASHSKVSYIPLKFETNKNKKPPFKWEPVVHQLVYPRTGMDAASQIYVIIHYMVLAMDKYIYIYIITH